jgi:hypothetical protein
MTPYERARELCTAIYEQHPCGCCWHIVLDDGNMDDGSVKACIRWANETAEAQSARLGDTRYVCKTPAACRELGPIMLAMRTDERLEVRCLRRD